MSSESRISTSENSRETPREFIREFITYVKLRARQVVIFSYVTLIFFWESLVDIKDWSIQRMFWGRSSFYRTSFHIFIAVVTIGALVSGVSTRLNTISAVETQGLDLSSGVIGRQDIISQSGTAESISSISEDEVDYRIFRHKVQSGESLSEIATLYSINPNSIRWANNLSDDTIKAGQVLRIPEINGAFVEVKAGDTLESIATANNGNVADIIDLNSNVLDYRDPQLQVGMEIFIPGGEIPLPTPTRRPYTYAYSPPSSSYTAPPSTSAVVPSGNFVHPLLNCGGWTWSRGYSAWHRGADMARSGGCWINASKAGTVTQAQWSSGGQGFMITIDHGGGLATRYYHGNGNFAVGVGQRVSAGQTIMYMGNTGYSFGTHLHFEVLVNGVRVNPEYYVKLR